MGAALPRVDGVMVYLLEPDGSGEEEPSVAFEHFRTVLQAEGLESSWQTNYNARANPRACPTEAPRSTKRFGAGATAGDIRGT